MLIPEILSNSVQGQGSLGTALSGLCTVLLLVLATSLLSQRFPRIKDVLEAQPTVLVEDGKLVVRAMNRERIAPDELYAEMRKQSIASLDYLRFAVLESGGSITFISRVRSSPPSSDKER